MQRSSPNECVVDLCHYCSGIQSPIQVQCPSPHQIQLPIQLQCQPIGLAFNAQVLTICWIGGQIPIHSCIVCTLDKMSQTHGIVTIDLYTHALTQRSLYAKISTLHFGHIHFTPGGGL